MTLIGTFILILFSMIALFSLMTNKDIFSPAKIYLFYLLLFNFALVYAYYPLEHFLTFFVFLMIGILLVLGESRTNYFPKHRLVSDSGENIASKLTILVWIFSFFSFMTQIYLIIDSGGIYQYINDAVYRATTWRGKGLLLMVIQSVMVFQIIYFAIGLYWNKKTKGWWLFFLVHLVLVLFIALLTGSRTVLLMNFIVMMIVYHYIRKPISISKSVSIVLILLVVASLFGIARNNLKISDGHFQTGLADSTTIAQKIRTMKSTFQYGLLPLNFIYSYEPKKLQYGLGLITPITNVVPRNIWPSKPDTSSMAMNKEYIEDRGPGPYQFPSGIIGLGVMNFGWPFGITFGFLFIILCAYFINYIYIKNIKNNPLNDFQSVLNLIISLFIVLSFPAIIPGELTNIFHGLLLTKIVPILLVITIYKQISKKNE